MALVPTPDCRALHRPVPHRANDLLAVPPGQDALQGTLRAGSGSFGFARNLAGQKIMKAAVPDFSHFTTDVGFFVQGTRRKLELSIEQVQ